MALIQYDNEYGRLRQVILYRPSLEEIYQEDPTRVMYRSTPDPQKVLEEFDRIVRTFEKLNVEVIVLSENSEPTEHNLTHNMIFLRDVAMVYRQYILLANMKHNIRKREPKKFQRLLVEYDKDFSKYIYDDLELASLEGADVLVNGKQLAIYTGSRTSNVAIETIQKHFADVDISKVKANIHGVPQHLLGGVHVIDSNLALRRVSFCDDAIAQLNFIDLSEDKEISEGFAMNIVTIAPRQILMPSRRPNTKKKLEKHGIVCHEVPIDEIHKMGGGLACMTLPLKREII